MSEERLIYRLYRCVTDTQTGSKDWAIGITGAATLVIRHGSTGETARLLEIPRAHFSTPTVATERRSREEAKLAHGYVYIGEAVVEKGHLVLLTPDGPDDAEKQPLDPSPIYRLHWEVHQPIDREAFCGELEWVTEQLQSAAVPGVLTYDAERGVCSARYWARWELGYSDQGGMGPDNRGGGVIVPNHGIRPVLIIVRLQNVFRGAIRVAHDNGELLALRMSPDDPVMQAHSLDRKTVMDLATRIGLCPGWVRLTRDGGDETSRGTWL
jgi:hypothetical protein